MPAYIARLMIAHGRCCLRHFAPERNERLVQAGRAILDDPGTYGAHLDRMEGARRRLRDAVSRMEGLSTEHRTQSQSRDRGPTRSL